MNIVYCTNSLSHFGGVERVTIAKATELAKKPGNNVWLIVTESSTVSFVIPPNVTLINLGINYYQGAAKNNPISQLFFLISKQRLHKQKLSHLFKTISPDIIVSTGGLEKHLLPSLRSDTRVLIREIHTPSDCRMFYAKTPYERILAKVRDFLDYRIFIKKYDRIVLLTEEDKNRNWKNNAKAIVIPNPLCLENTVLSPLNGKTVISIGKLSKGKNFTALIRSWRLVHGRHPEWKLLILGDGEEKTSLLSQIKDFNLNSCVSITGWVNNIDSYLESASIFAFSSLSEGFGLVIIDAMAAGIPVVSFACPYGPMDIISNGVDGFLVPLGDEDTLAEKICYLIENDVVRKEMGASAKINVMRFSMNRIIEDWTALFNSLLANKPRT